MPSTLHDLRRDARALGPARSCEATFAAYEIIEDLGEFTIAGAAGPRAASGYTLEHCTSEHRVSWRWPGARPRALAWLRGLVWSALPDPLPSPDAPAPAWPEMDAYEELFPESYPDDVSPVCSESHRVLAFLDDHAPLAAYEAFEGIDRCGLCLEFRHRAARIDLRLDAGAVRFERARIRCVSADPDTAAHACASAAWTMTLPDGRAAAVPDYAALLAALAA